jgi:hypothetical protein
MVSERVPELAPTGRHRQFVLEPELLRKRSSRITSDDGRSCHGGRGELSPPRLLFEQRYAFGAGITLPNYDVMRDGRFVMVKDESSAGRLNVILNWPSEIARLAPAK